MGSISKLVKSGIKDAEIKEDNLATGVATTLNNVNIDGATYTGVNYEVTSFLLGAGAGPTFTFPQWQLELQKVF